MYYVYITGNDRPTLYIGVTNDLLRRVYEHKENLVEGFTKQHALHMLLYYEECPNVKEAIRREKQLKKWNRAWKLRLIRTLNLELEDLYPSLFLHPKRSPLSRG